MSTYVVGTEKTVKVRLGVADSEWEIGPGRSVSGYGFNRHVPGPTIEAGVGDTLVLELRNSPPEPRNRHRRCRDRVVVVYASDRLRWVDASASTGRLVAVSAWGAGPD